MTPRTRRVVVTVVTLAILQGLAIVGYVLATREPAGPGEFRFEPLSARPTAPIQIETAARTLEMFEGSSDRVTLVHFWATWCKPCRNELPGLLAEAASLDPEVRLVAIAVDDSWPAIESFFAPGKTSPAIVRAADAEGPRRWGATELPDTYVVDRRGQIVERYLGARDWSSTAAELHLRQLAQRLSR